MVVTCSTASRVLVLALLLVLAAGDARAQTCDAGVFTRAVESSVGVSVRMTRSSAVFSTVDGWSLLSCFVLAHRGTSTSVASAVLRFRAGPGPTAPVYPLVSATMAPVGGVQTVCQVLPDLERLAVATVEPLLSFEVSEECCVMVRSAPAPLCADLPHEGDRLEVEVTDSVSVVGVTATVQDTARGAVASGRIALCGMTGIEILVVPLFQLLLRRSRRARARSC